MKLGIAAIVISLCLTTALAYGPAVLLGAWGAWRLACGPAADRLGRWLG